MNIVVLAFALVSLVVILLVACLGYTRRERVIEDYKTRIRYAEEIGDTSQAQILREDLLYFRIHGEGPPAHE